MATKTRKKPTRQYSDEYPVIGGHSYMIRSVPVKTWRAVDRRRKAEGGRSVRTIIIKLLERYEAEGAAAFGGWPEATT